MDIAAFDQYVQEQSEKCDMRRVILHWTGGGYRASQLDRQHYHAIAEDDGKIILGEHPISANSDTSNGYAAHVRNLNTKSIGLCVAGMGGSTSPRDAHKSPFPITPVQMDTLHAMAASCCYHFDIDHIDVVHHGAVEDVYGVAQKGKWDVMWLKWAEGDVQAWTWNEVAEILETRNNPVQEVTIRFDDTDRSLIGFMEDSQAWAPLRKTLSLMGADQVYVHNPTKTGVTLIDYSLKRLFRFPAQTFPMQNRKGTGYVPVRALARWLGWGIYYDGEVHLTP